MPNPLSSASVLRPLGQAGLVLLAAMWLTGCGQKGPLYLPADEPAPANVDEADDAPEATNDSMQD